MKIFFTSIFFLFIAYFAVYAIQDSLYEIKLNVSLGASYNYFDKPRVYSTKDKTSIGLGASFRIMWHPARMLALGIMTGYYKFSNDEVEIISNDGTIEKANAELTGIPLQAFFSMYWKKFEIGLGIGPYLMRSEINYGKTAQGLRSELGLTFISSYSFSITDNLYIAPEIRTIYMRYRSIFSFVPTINFKYETMRY